MLHIDAAQLPAAWSETLDLVTRKRTRVVVEAAGSRIAAIIPIEDFEALERLDAQRERGFAAMERISRAFSDVPIDELERHVSLAVSEARAEKRSEDHAHSS